jgi:hypothetical protein
MNTYFESKRKKQQLVDSTIEHERNLQFCRQELVNVTERIRILQSDPSFSHDSQTISQLDQTQHVRDQQRIESLVSQLTHERAALPAVSNFADPPPPPSDFLVSGPDDDNKEEKQGKKYKKGKKRSVKRR